MVLLGEASNIIFHENIQDQSYLMRNLTWRQIWKGGEKYILVNFQKKRAKFVNFTIQNLNSWEISIKYFRDRFERFLITSPVPKKCHTVFLRLNL